jgi:hypothetical protein
MEILWSFRGRIFVLLFLHGKQVTIEMRGATIEGGPTLQEKI